MRAQCCICSDLFENSPSVNIAAAPCGHTFHEACLMRWMENSSTCPSCRTPVKRNLIIKRLFFDSADDHTQDDDTDRLLNQLGNLRAQLSEKEKKESELKESRDLYRHQLSASESLCAELTTKLNQKHDQIDMLQKTLAYTQKENTAYLEEMKEFHKTRKKLLDLETIDSMLKGCDPEIRDIVRQYNDGGESSVKTLASMLTVLRQEYNKVLSDKKGLLTKVSTLQKKVGHYHAAAKSYREKELELKAELEKAYESLTKSEKENNEKRRKLVHLRNALRYNKTEGSQSFHQALNEDSPNVAFTPPPSASSDDLDLTPPQVPEIPQSPDLFDSPASPPPSHRTGDFETPKLKFFKVPTAKEKFQAAKKAKIENEDAPKIPSTFYSIMQKKVTGVSNSRAHVPSVITRGYDGFGGSTNFVQPLGPPKSQIQKKLHCVKLKKAHSGPPKLLNNQRLLKDCVQNVPMSLSLGATIDNETSTSKESSCCTSLPGKEQVKAKSGFLYNKMSFTSSRHILSSVPKLTSDNDIIDLT
ncbi:E3 ubiquitin-protein ligase TRAIP [Biomphalaria glabrata]|nr:E3 ubiquitin-protein ligase TRAIP-like [Biomphalaria glabrata]